MAFDATGIRVFVALRQERSERADVLGVYSSVRNATDACEQDAVARHDERVEMSGRGYIFHPLEWAEDDEEEKGARVAKIVRRADGPGFYVYEVAADRIDL